tara:strand:+ start:293 stop:3589 length:3297 start_codon:yes stop_codon:yes gene_type:complete
MEIFDNIKSISKFETQFYFTIRSESNSNGKYTKPIEVALKERKCNEYTIKYDEESNKGLTYTKYGNLTYEKLSNIWKNNNHLYEIIPDNTPFKFYLDIDKRFESDSNNKETLKILKELIENTLEINFDDASISFGKGNKDDYIKVSWHIVFNNGIYFKNMNECKIFINYLKYKVVSEDKYFLLKNGVLDFIPYKSNQAFKLPFQSKAFKNIIQIPEDTNCKIEDYLLTYKKGEIKYYDVSKFDEIMKPILTTKTHIKTASGKIIKVEYTDSVILKDYMNSFNKDFKLGKVLGSKLKNKLKYFLDSIPNNSKVSMKVWKTIGYSISKILKNSEAGLDLWTSWTSGYKPIDKEKLRKMYMKHNIESGYGYKMLYKLASIHNNLIDEEISCIKPLFEYTPSFKCVNKEINCRFIANEFNMKETVNKFDVICIKSPMGTGKSYSLNTIFENENYKSILYLSCKRAFATCMKSDFKKYGFKSYLEIENKNDIQKNNRIICSVESASHLRDGYDLVIIDESESICDNLTGQMMMNNKPLDNIKRIYKIVKNSSKIMLMDAYLTTRSFNMVKDIYGEAIEKKKCYHLINKFQYPERVRIDCLSKGVLGGTILNKLKDGKRCVLVCGSKKLSDGIAILCKDYKISYYSSSNPLPNGCNVNEVWNKCQLLIYTPTVTAGISYTNKDFPFDNLFIYAVNKHSAHIRDIIQAHKRVRHFNDNKIYTVINGQAPVFNYDMLPVSKKSIEELEYKYKTLLFDEDVISLKMNEETKWIYNINIHNKLESNINTLYICDLAQRYFEEENIINSNTCKKDELEYLNEINEVWNYDDIKDIEKNKHRILEQQIKNHTINTPKLTEEEFKEYIKFNYTMKHVKDDLSIPIAKGFFNQFYGDKLQSKKNGSVRTFKQMLYDINYDTEKYTEWKEKRLKDPNRPFEIYDFKLLRYEHLLKFLNKLKLIEPSKLNINVEFLGSDFDQFIDEYKNLNTKTLNSMLEESYITQKGKKFTGIQIKSIFNNLLKEEFGMEILKVGTKQFTIDGKRKKTSKFTIRNYCEPPNSDDDDDEAKRKRLFTEKFGKSEYNRFNIYKDHFQEEEQQYSFKKDDSDYESN